MSAPDELKPCPFCGAPAYMTSKPPWVVTCPADACAAFIDVPGSTADDAAARWNRRAPTAPQGAEPVAWQLMRVEGTATDWIFFAKPDDVDLCNFRPLYAAPQGAEIARDSDCICYGNWRLIIKECEHLIGRRFRDCDGHDYVFFGVVHADDDYYYGMRRTDGALRLLSCVGDLETNGMQLDDAALTPTDAETKG